MEKLQYVPAIHIDQYEFVRRLTDDVPSFMALVRESEKEIKEASDYRWGNSITSVTNIFGNAYKFIIYGMRLTIYNETGGTEVFSGTMPTDTGARNAFLHKAIEATEDYSMGFVVCSDPDCGKRISYQENKGHTYFAGIYCTECWDRKWKAIEAKENYE